MGGRDNTSDLVAMLAGGIQGYTNYKNQQQIREEDRAARQEQLALQTRMMQAQEDQAAWQRTFSEKQLFSAEEQAALARLDAKEARRETFTHEEKILQMQLRARANGGNPLGGSRVGRDPMRPLYEQAMETVKQATTDAQRSAYEQGLTGAEAAAYVENATMAATLSLPPFLQQALYGIQPGMGAAPVQAQPQPPPPGFVSTGDRTTDRYNYAISAKRVDDNRLPAARATNRTIRNQRGGSLSTALATGAATPADVQAEYDRYLNTGGMEGIDFEQYQDILQKRARAEADGRLQRARTGGR